MSTPRSGKISLPLITSSRTRSQDEPLGSEGPDPPIVRFGYLRKLKTNRRKWFVLFGPTPTQPARLAYYENEKKWKVRGTPKREIILEKCFNINRKQDTKDSRDRWVIALYTLDDCVSVLFETEAELNDWLDQLLTLQQGKRGNVEGKKPKPTYEHMWQVSIKSFKPDAGNNGVFPTFLGPHRLCVTNSAVKFFALGEERCHEFPHACLRSCGYNDRVFEIQTGRNSASGAGRIHLECDDKDATRLLHETVLESMKASKSKDLYLRQSHTSSRPRSASVSNPKPDSLTPHPPKSIPPSLYAHELGSNRPRTISEPPWESGGVSHKTRLGFSTSPSIHSPISPLGSVSVISSDGTGSSNSINEHGGGAENQNETPTTGLMAALPEESSGEMSIELPGSGAQQAQPREHKPPYIYHRKQLSLTDCHVSDDPYMLMTGPERVPHPAFRYQVGAPSYSSSLPSDSGMAGKLPSQPSITSPVDSQTSSFYSESGGSRVMSPGTTPTLGPPDPDCAYLVMDMLSVKPVDTSTPVKSSSSHTLVPSPDTVTTTPHQQPCTTTPLFSSTPQTIVGSPASFAKTPPVAIRNDSVTTTSQGRTRIPSGDSGYEFMSPGVAINPDQFRGIIEEPSSRTVLEERLGGPRKGFGSPRHSSPATRRPPSRTGSKRNSSCYDDNEWLVGVEQWRLVEDVSDDHLEGGGMDRHSPKPDDVYMSIDYPRGQHHSMSGTGPRPLSRVSPASSSSLVSGTPSSDSRFGDFHLEKVVSCLRDDDDDKVVTSRPPRAMTLDTVSRRVSPKYIEIPGVGSKSSSRCNLSPFGRSPPGPGAASSPSVVTRMYEGMFRNRAGSVPTRQPMLERRRHRTQSEGEKDLAEKDS